MISRNQAPLTSMGRVVAPLFASLALLLPSAVGPAGHRQPVELVKGQVYTLAVPRDLLSNAGYGKGWVAEVSGSVAALQVSGRSDWKVSGFPSLPEVKFEKVSGGKNFTDLEFRRSTDSGIDVKLRFPSGYSLREVSGHLVIAGRRSGEAAQAYLKEAFGLLEEKLFVGSLASVSPEKKRALTTFVHDTDNRGLFRTETYEKNIYMVVDLGSSESIYNDRQTSEAARLALAINGQILNIIKAFAKPVSDVPQLFGLKLELRISHTNLADFSAPLAHDVLQFYAPAELIKKFRVTEITSQKLVDGCVAILNGKEVPVTLSDLRHP